MILRQILGPKRNENAEWSRLDNKELHRVIKSRRLRLAGQVSRMEEARRAFRILGKRRLGRPKRR